MARAALTRSNRAAYLASLDHAADAAAVAAGSDEERRYEINGNFFRLRFAGPATLVSVGGALSHLSAPPIGDSSLTIRVWDGGPSKLPAPEGPWMRAGEHEGVIRGQLPGGEGFFQWYAGSLAVLDLVAQAGYYWVQDARRDAMPAPLSPILGGWLAQDGIELVQAGAVGTDRGCILLAGRSGSGKSHAALACVQDGLGYLGDDACALDAKGAPRVHSIYGSAWASPFTRRSLPALQRLISSSDRRHGEKVLLSLGDRMPGSLLRQAPLHAIAVMSFSDDEETYVRRVSPTDAMLALAPSSLLPQARAGQRMLTRLARIARSVACVEIRAGSDPSSLARAIRALL